MVADRSPERPPRHDFQARLRQEGRGPLRRERPTMLQINVGKRCNQACLHCHVDAGPKRTEVMDARTAEAVVALLDRSPGVEAVDVTGGAPELNPSFRWLVREVRARGLRVMDRCNLTVLLEPGQEELAGFLREHEVELICSLPCYGPVNVERQRGKGVFGRSIEALRRLNALGYGVEGGGPPLDLVYNPVGPSLPPAQAALEADYREHLRGDFGVEFTRLLTLTNMPIARFAHTLEREGRHQEYMDLLASAFNPATIEGLMCRHLVSVDWRGRLFDCDFNQMLDLPLGASGARSVFDLGSLDDLDGEGVAVDSHCFGCTAGAGSSCGGALS
ncbi:MAG: arsenosugar biosynthesis radical SAM (seleno)protein ArsS [Myxococcota bacterium]